MTSLGRKLRQLRQQRGLTQQQIATRIGCPQVSISRYERGWRRPGTPRIAALARTFGVTEKELKR